MRPRTSRPLPRDREALLRKAVKLEIATLVAMSAVTLMMFLAAGQSQAMKTAWVEDLLSLVPSIAFLVSVRFARRPPDREYVNGRARAFDIAFLVSAVALTGVGIGLIVDGVHALVTATHPTIGTVEIAGVTFWQGWLMMGALLVSCVPPAILGRMKLPLAKQLSLKSLHTDADTSKADWMTGAAGVVGVAGIGMGWWWADAAAALFISGSVLHDGVQNLRHAIRDVHDARPETVERGCDDPLVDEVKAAVRRLDWVADCDVRLHEEGMRLSGLLAVRARDGAVRASQLREAEAVARRVSWRIDAVDATAVDAGDADGAADAAGKGARLGPW